MSYLIVSEYKNIAVTPILLIFRHLRDNETRDGILCDGLLYMIGIP